jgi:choice-of-anchor A domain-containing protein
LALTLTSLAVLPGVTGTAGAASCLSVGPAGNYSEYTSTGVAEASDTVAGPAAYGGPSNNISGLHVGSGLPPSAVSLVLGAASTVNNSVLVNGSAEYVGTLGGSGDTGTFTSEPSQSSLPVQFGPAQSSLAAAATALDALPATDPSTVGSTVTLTSAGPGTDVFDLTAAQLQAASSVVINAPAGAVVVVDVSGSSLSLSATTVSLAGGVTPTNVIWNMPSGAFTAESYSAVTWYGTIIQSAGYFSMSASHVYGSILTGASTPSFSANTVALDLFNGCSPGTSTPEAPATLLLPVAGLGVGGAFLARRRGRERRRVPRS